MSLINDALRRAKDAQQQAPPAPPPNLPFRPVEPAPPRRSTGLLVLGVLALVALLVLIFAWQHFQTRDSTGSMAAIAQPALGVHPVPAAQSNSDSAPALTTRPASVTESETPATATAAKNAHLVADATSAATNAPNDEATEATATNSTALASAPPPKPAAPRLQGIVFNPKRPSAMISGKTLFVGEKLGDLRVVAIDKESVTLIGGGQTNVLILGE